MIIAKKFIPVVLVCSMAVNLSAFEEPVLLNELADLVGENAVVADEDLINESTKTGLVAKLRKHKRAILIGLGCVAAAGAIVYRGEISEFFKKLIDKKNDTEGNKNSLGGGANPLNNSDSSEKPKPDQNSKLEVNGCDVNINSNNPSEAELPQENNDVKNQDFEPKSDQKECDLFDQEDETDIVSNFFADDENNADEIYKKQVDDKKKLNELVSEVMVELDKNLKKKPVLSPIYNHSGFSGTLPNITL